jgi:putative ABC transport system permease protein
MGRILLVGRLAVRDLRRRRIEAALLLLAIMAATTTLTLGLVLREAASDPYQSTREATNGPDVVASVSQPAERSGLEELAGAPGVIDYSGPYPVTPAELQASGRTSDVQAVGRDAAPASVDQPELVQGSWVSDGGVVVEAAFANVLDVRVGDPVTLDGRSFEVVGVAVTAAMPPYPEASCIVPVGCMSGATPDDLAGAELPPGLLLTPGLVWLTQADVRSLTPDADSLAFVMNLKLAEPAEARAFIDANQAASLDAPGLES